MSERNDDALLIFSSYTHYRRWLATLIPAVIPDIDVSFQQLNVLYYVRVADASMADIARVLGVAPTVITGLVDRLEGRELIRREPHPGDRRRIRLVLTERGREISTKVEEAVAARIEDRVAALTPEQQRHLREGLVLFDQLMVDLEAQARLDNPAGSELVQSGNAG